MLLLCYFCFYRKCTVLLKIKEKNGKTLHSSTSALYAVMHTTHLFYFVFFFLVSMTLERIDNMQYMYVNTQADTHTQFLLFTTAITQSTT